MKKLKTIEKIFIPLNLNCIAAQRNPKPNEKIYTSDFPKRQLPKNIFQSSNFLNV